MMCQLMMSVSLITVYKPWACQASLPSLTSLFAILLIAAPVWGCRYAGVAMGKLQAQLLSFIPSVVRRFSYSVNHLSMTGQSSTNLSFLPLPWMYILEVHSSTVCSHNGCIVFFHGMFSSQVCLLSAQHSSVSIDS